MEQRSPRLEVDIPVSGSSFIMKHLRQAACCEPACCEPVFCEPACCKPACCEPACCTRSTFLQVRHNAWHHPSPSHHSLRALMKSLFLHRDISIQRQFNKPLGTPPRESTKALYKRLRGTFKEQATDNGLMVF